MCILQFDASKLRKLRPSFKDGGSVTAGNASIIRYSLYFMCIYGEKEYVGCQTS